MDERVEAARLFRREPFLNFKAFDFPGDLAREFGRVETRDTGDAGFAGNDASPCFGNANPDRRDDAESGYNYSASCQWGAAA